MSSFSFFSIFFHCELNVVTVQHVLPLARESSLFLIISLQVSKLIPLITNHKPLPLKANLVGSLYQFKHKVNTIQKTKKSLILD